MQGYEHGRQAEMVSFSMDPQWCGLLFSVYCRHEKGGFLGQPDAFAFSVAGPPLDADLIAWAGSFGFEICTVPSTWALVLESVKATGFLLVVGVGGLFCYKLFNLCWARTRNRLASSDSSASLTGDKDDEERLLGRIQGEYFGPKTTSQESLVASPAADDLQVWNTFGLGSNSSTEGGTSGDDEARDADVSDGSPCEKQNLLRRQKHGWASPRTWRPPRHITSRKPSDTLVGRINTMLVTDPLQVRDVSLHLPLTPSGLRKNKRATTDLVDITLNQTRLPRDESYDSLGFSRHLPRNGSFDSTSSDISLDYSLPETIELEDTNTIVSLDKLQQEIDSLKSNCLMMDEEFETIKCNRNFPGMSSLMKANTSHSSLAAPNTVVDAETGDSLKRQKARACFAGLYSLTTIKNSTSSELSDSFAVPAHGRGSIGSAESLDWDSPKAAASPARFMLGDVSEDPSTTVTEEPSETRDDPGARLGPGDLEEMWDVSPSIEERSKVRRKNSPSSQPKITRQNSERKNAQRSRNMSERSLVGSEDELMENLEWDEEVMTEYPESELGRLPTSEGLEMDLEVELSLSRTDAMNRSVTASPLTERSSKMESSGFESKMADSTASVQSSQFFSDGERNSRPWGWWSSEESGFVECDGNNAQDRNTAQPSDSCFQAWDEAQSSANISEQSTPASETAPLDLNSQLPLQSIGPKVNILQYAVKEWHGQTTRAETILRGYAEIPKLLNLEHLRRIRGDNYCGIRAAIFQTLARGLPVPSGENAFRCLADAVANRGFGWLQDWSFAGRLPYRGNNVLHGMKTCLSSLDNVASLLSSSSSEDREETLAQLLNSDPTLDLHLVEGVKLQMLGQAIELHDANSSGREVPLFAMLMFARDSSETPRDFMNNHLHEVGNTSGLEQVEMFLLGYTLGITLLVVRPAAHGTEDFLCTYPDWNVGVWPQVVLIAEDDRHYNVLVN